MLSGEIMKSVVELFDALAGDSINAPKRDFFRRRLIRKSPFYKMESPSNAVTAVIERLVAEGWVQEIRDGKHKGRALVATSRLLDWAAHPVAERRRVRQSRELGDAKEVVTYLARAGAVIRLPGDGTAGREYRIEPALGAKGLEDVFVIVWEE